MNLVLEGVWNKPGIDLSVDGNTIFVEGERNSDVTVGLVSQEFDLFPFLVIRTETLMELFLIMVKITSYKLENRTVI